MICTHTLGYPRIGPKREWKFALEAFWAGKSDEAELASTWRTLRLQQWDDQRKAGLDMVTAGDFAPYDHIAAMTLRLGAAPARFGFEPGQSRWTRHFAMARGTSSQPALELTKWFDTNYHYLVPEVDAATRFAPDAQDLLDELALARAQGMVAKPVLPGPLTWLWLSKSRHQEFDRLTLLPALIDTYVQILKQLHTAGAAWVQLDEPILALDMPSAWQDAMRSAYAQIADALGATSLKLLVAVYFGPLEDNLDLACQLPVAGLHLDLVRGLSEAALVVERLSADKVLSAGVIDGRNIWRDDLDAALALLRSLNKRGGDLWIAPSCSLLHLPVDLDAEDKLPQPFKGGMAFARQKLGELHLLAQALCEGDTLSADTAKALEDNRTARANRLADPSMCRAELRARIANLPSDQRTSGYVERAAKQRARFALPLLPTTTIGSFPQTADIRGARAAFKRGEISHDQYEERMREAIAMMVRKQEELGLDVLVHGEAERNDMVEYFGEQLEGVLFTQYGWVQSYGSRCVKPPVIFGDVVRPKAMTVQWSSYAQSLTKKPMKGMLTGPVTLLQWAFVRDDLPRSEVALQLALAVRDEVQDLEAAGIGMIQIDEPA
ncbi:MAG: 5-methyltetrahydropteroyltriglutamate--homocysteine S-methyltransferase, partial [Stenotrophomonas sp.]|uniref:5-methyltetrahydropteroyltriglutamate-- homocysteine S-methyltransferase n=1 Tax=Stenotrophomonas sp. TaxID=69392 RepID=UPI0019BAD2D3